MKTILLLGDPPVMRPGRMTESVLARVRGASLDASLAAGRPPESSALLATRAQHIVALRRRLALAGHWEHLLAVARRAQRGRSGGFPAGRAAVPLAADQVIAAEPAIRNLINRLRAPLPVPARGVAQARLLLTDATSPVYNRHAATALTAALAEAVAQLDPARPLMAAARS